MARRHPATERFRGSATGLRGGPGSFQGLGHGFAALAGLAVGDGHAELPVVVERKGAVQDLVPAVGALSGQGFGCALHLPGCPEASESERAVPDLIEARLQTRTLLQLDQSPLPMFGDAERPAAASPFRQMV